MSASRRGASVAGTFALILLAIVGLFIIDRELAKAERAESRREAERLFTEGQRLAQAGKYSLAIERFRAALSAGGEYETCAVALADALLKAGKLQAAESVLDEILQRDSISGEANLTMARVLKQQGKIAEAESYYHRAIYDQWPKEAIHHRLLARLELIELLGHDDKKKELLSELLTLQDEAGGDIEILKRIAPLYLAAGLPAHASEAFRDILRYEAGDAKCTRVLAKRHLQQLIIRLLSRISRPLFRSIRKTETSELVLKSAGRCSHWILRYAV